MNEVATRDESQRPGGGENLEVMRDAVNYNRYLRQLVRRYGETAATALDFGAGIGTFSDSPGLDPGAVHCVEPDAAARRQLESLGFAAHESLASVPDGAVDYVFTLNVLEHIEDDRAALADIYRVLKPGGRLFVYVPAFMALFSSMDRHVGHVRRYRLPEMVDRVEGAGFRVSKKTYADFLGFFATLVLKMFDGPEPAPLSPGPVRCYDRLIFPVSRLLSVPFGRILGKNLYVVASKPARGAAD